jgi:hypothetical protein
MWKGHGEIGSTQWGHIRKMAEVRGIPFLLTIEDAWSLFLRQQRLCAITNCEIAFAKTARLWQTGGCTASLDRIDSNGIYELHNVQWVHKVVNLMKLNTPQAEFIEWCHIISRANQHSELATAA